MRIDEFSNAADIDGAISTTEQTQFLLFGFDIALAAPPVVASFFEQIAFISRLSTSITFSFISSIVKQFNFNSKLDK